MFDSSKNILIAGGTFSQVTYTNYDDPEKIADKISDISFDKTYQAISSARTKDTGQWLLENKTFKTWRDSDSTQSILWITGEPGVGKTYLSSLVIEHLFETTQKSRAVAFLFCDHTKQLSINDLLGSLLRQLVIRLPVSVAVSKWWNGQKQPLNTEQLNDLLLAQMGDATVYILSDALDECKAQSELIKTFRRLLGEGRAHIVITTRPNLAHLIENHDFRIDAKSIGDDIWKFVDQYISNPKEDRFKCLQRLVSTANPINGQPFRSYLIEEVVEKASERFLIARLQIDALAKAKNRKELTASLRDLSADINQMYEQNIRRIPEDDQRMAFQVFSWVVFAYRPLRVGELQHAIAIDLADENLSDIEDTIYPWETILEGCAGLLMINDGPRSEPEVALVHETTYEYFRCKIPGNTLFNQPSDLGFACAKYLTFDEAVFTTYAAIYWGMHCENLPEISVLALSQFLREHETEVVKKTNDAMSWHDSGWPQRARNQTLFHILCWFGLDSLILESSDNIEVRDSAGWTPVFYAASAGCASTVKFLVEQGANLHLVDENGRSSLSYATEYGGLETVQVLVEKGADINLVDNDGRSVLSYAIQQKSLETAKFLAEKGADTMKEGSDWFAVFNPNPKLDVDLVHTLMHGSVVCCVRFSADGRFLATGCNRTAQIYDTKTGANVCVLADDSAVESGVNYMRSMCFSPDGKFLATGSDDKLIRIWDIAKKGILNTFEGHQQGIYSVNFSLDGQLIISGSGDKTVRIWDMHDGTSKVLTVNNPDYLDNGVCSVAISPNGLLAAGCLDAVVWIWDVQTGVLVEQLGGHLDSVYSVAFTPGGKGLVSGSLDGTLKYWDVRGLTAGGNGKERKDAAAAYYGGAASPFASGSSNKDDKSVVVSAEGGGADEEGSGEGLAAACTMNFMGHDDYVLSVAVSHDGQWVVSGSKDRRVQFWDAHSAIIQCMLQGHMKSVISIDLSPVGNVLATGGGDWQARIWSYDTI